MFALYGQIFQGQFVTKIEQCTRCPQLSVETYTHACNNERAKRVQKSKQGRSEQWQQTRKREPILWKSLLLHLQAAKKKEGTCNNELQVGDGAHLISTVLSVSAVYLHE